MQSIMTNETMKNNKRRRHNQPTFIPSITSGATKDIMCLLYVNTSLSDIAAMPSKTPCFMACTRKYTAIMNICLSSCIKPLELADGGIFGCYHCFISISEVAYVRSKCYLMISQLPKSNEYF